MKRKWQRVLSWILTLTMLISTFQGTGFTVNAAPYDPSDTDVSIDVNAEGIEEAIVAPVDGSLDTTVTLTQGYSGNLVFTTRQYDADKAEWGPCPAAMTLTADDYFSSEASAEDAFGEPQITAAGVITIPVDGSKLEVGDDVPYTFKITGSTVGDKPVEKPENAQFDDDEYEEDWTYYQTVSIKVVDNGYGIEMPADTTDVDVTGTAITMTADTAVPADFKFTIDHAYAGTGVVWKLLRGTEEVTISDIAAGLSFDSATGTFSGTPTEITNEPISLTVKADTTGADKEPKTVLSKEFTIEVEAPEGTELPHTIISDTDVQDSTWGSWTKAATDNDPSKRILVLNMQDNVPQSAPLQWTVKDYQNATVTAAEWDILDSKGVSQITVENGKKFFKGMEISDSNGVFKIWGMPTEILTEGVYTLKATVYGQSAVYLMTINIGRTMHVYSNGNLRKPAEAGAFEAWAVFRQSEAGEMFPDLNNDGISSFFYFALGGNGVISDGELQFKASSARVANGTAFADISEEKKVTWELFEADTEDDFTWNEEANARVFNKEAYAKVALNSTSKLHGLTLENKNGVLIIRGQADKTLSTSKKEGAAEDGAPKAFILRATNDNVEGNPAYSEKYGEYDVYILFEAMDSLQKNNGDLNWSEADRTATDYSVKKGNDEVVAAGQLTEDTWYSYNKTAAPDYQINTSGTNKVVPISFTLKNANEFLNMTGVYVTTEDLEDTNPLYVKDDCKNFTVTNGVIETLNKGKDNKLEFTVQPNLGLTARGNAYAARIVVYADQLPVEGFEIGRIFFTVANDFILTNGDGEVIETTLLAEEKWYNPTSSWWNVKDAAGNPLEYDQKAKIKTYSFDAGTYVAGNDMDPLKVIVTGSDISMQPTFEANGNGKLGVAVDEYLPNMNRVTFQNRDYVDFGGTIDPTAWYKYDLNDPDMPVKEWVSKVPGTDFVKYSLPLVVRDKNDTMVCFMAEFTIKPADLGLVLDGSEVKDKDVFSWHATEGTFAVDEKTNASIADRAFEITNTNDEDLKIWVALTEGNFEIADVKDAEKNLKEYTIKSGETAKIVIRPDADLKAEQEPPYADKTFTTTIAVYGKSTWIEGEAPDAQTHTYEDKVLLQSITLNFTVISDKTHKIVEPEGNDKNKKGLTFADARQITIGVGEVATWNVKYEGGFTDPIKAAQFDLVAPGVETSTGVVTGDNNQLPYVYETTGLKAFGFQWDKAKGQLTTTGATVDTSADGEVRDHFTICISAKYGPDDEDVVYSYYTIKVEKTDKAIVLEGQNKTLKATFSEDPAGDVQNQRTGKTADAAEIAIGRNLILEANEDSIEPAYTTITMKNVSKATMKDVKLHMESFKKVGVDQGTDLTNNSGNPFAGLSLLGTSETWDWTKNHYVLGDIAAGDSLRFSVDIKALHFNDVAPGTYTALIKVTGADMKDQYVVVILTVNNAPKLGGLNYKYDTTGTDVVKETNPALLANYHTLAAGAVDRTNNALVAHDFTGAAQANDRFANKPYGEVANVIAGEKVKLGESLDLQLTAQACDGTILRKTEVEYTWKETIPGSDASIEQSGFELSLDGQITGTAAKPGTYYMTVHMHDKREDVDIKTRDGYADICIYVPGAVELDLTTHGDKKVLGPDWKDLDLWIFDGAVAGDTVSADAAKEIIVHNKSNNTTATGLTVTLKDDPSKPGMKGSADHFVAELDSTTIAPNGTAKLVVKPSNVNVKEGWYEAFVEISGANAASVTFPVRWLVSRKLTVTLPSLEETKTRTGAKDYSLTLKANGAGIAYDADGNLLKNDEPWWDGIYDAANAYKQNVYWGLRIKNDTGSNEELIKLAEALKEMGFEVDVTLKGDNHSYDKGIVNNLIINESVIYVAIGENNRLDSRFNELATKLVTGGKNWSFTAVALVEPCFASANSDVKVLPSQSAEMDITLQVTPSSDVYVAYDKIAYPDTYSGISTFEMVAKHKNLVAQKDDADWVKTIREYNKVTSFTFRDQAEGYAVDGNNAIGAQNSREFVVFSELGNVPLRAEAKIVSEDRVTKSTYFDLNVKDAFYLNHTGEETYASKELIVKVHEKLPASETPYTGILIVSGIGFDDIEIPLSVTVSPRNYDIDVYGDVVCNGKNENLTVIGEDGFNTKEQKVGSDDVPTASIGKLAVFTVGNQRVTLTRVEEVTGPDADASVVAKKDEKLALTLEKPAVNVSGPAGTIDPAWNVAAPKYTDSDYQFVDLKVKHANTVSSGSAYVRVVYMDEATIGKESSKTVKVNYVVYADGIAYTTDPFQLTPYQMGEAKVSEGYNVSDNVVTFTITNDDTHIGDESYALYNTTVTIDFGVNDGYDLFTVNGKNTDKGVVKLTAKKIMPGESTTFTVEPIEGLPAGNNAYEPNIIIKPVNAAVKEQKLSFNVVRNDDFRTYAFTSGYEMVDGWKQRVEDTLLQMYKATTEKYVVVQAPHEGHAWTMADGYYINLNSDDEKEKMDVWVYFDKDNNNMLTIVKLDTSDEGQYSNPIINPSYSASSTKHEFASMRFDVLETVTYDWGNNWFDGDYYLLGIDAKGGIIIDGVDLGPIDGVAFAKAFPGNFARGNFTFLVPYGKTLGEAIVVTGTRAAYSDKFVEIKGYSGDKSLDVFMDIDDKESIGTKSVIKKDRDLMPKFHTHTYYQEDDTLVVYGDKEANGKPVVTWEWIGSEEDGYTDAVVTLHCVDPLCNDYEGSAVVYDSHKNKKVTVTADEDRGSCTDGGFTKYTAEVTGDVSNITNITYISSNEAKHVGEVDRHEYTFDWDHVRLYNLTDFDNAYAEVVKTCQSDIHDVNRDGQREVTVSNDKVEFIGTKPTCEEDGEGYYHFIFEDPDIPAADIEAGKNIVSSNKIVVDKIGHKWKAVSANWEGGSYTEKPRSASLNLVCQNDESHTAVLTVNAQGITEERTEESVTYTAIGYYEDQQVDYSITYASHTDHEWSVSFNWVTVSVNLVDTKVTATATCLTGGEKEELLVKVTEEITGNIKTYTAKATDPAGKEWSESKTIDLKTGEEVTHEHVWSKPAWDWTGTTSVNGVAKATFTCSVSGNHSVTLDATVSEKSRNAKKVVYYAVVTGPDEKEYNSTYTYDIASGSGKIGGDDEIEILDGHFVIIGLEAEYPYTGKKITPAFKVRDVDRDILLGEKTDYTVKFTNNKDKGEATVTIKGKGNYKGTNAEAKFKIVDPLEYNGLTSDELATVKSIKKVNASGLVYTGKKQYPASIIVKTKDAGEITLTLEDAEEGTYTSSNEEKTLALSIVNNVKKGTATVAATGADGKTKSKTFKIKAADISSVNVEVEEEAIWGVKAQEVRLNATFGDDEIELAPGGDFKAKYTAKNAGENAGSVKLTGKGNFKGSKTVAYTVNALELSEENIIIDTKLAKKGPKTKVTVVDNAGNKLKNKNHYNASVAVGDENEVTVTVTAGKKSGSNIDFGDEGVSASATAASQKLGKFSAKGLVKYYTGSPITLDEEDFSKITGTGTLDEDFKVVSYKNNIKKGNMIVTVQGIGNYSGVKTFKVKIAPKPFNQVVEQ